MPPRSARRVASGQNDRLHQLRPWRLRAAGSLQQPRRGCAHYAAQRVASRFAVLGELRHHLGRHQLERRQDLAAVMDALRDQEDHLVLVGDDLLHLLQPAADRVG